jgi:nucleoside-diphosphate-sugar epimerase
LPLLLADPGVTRVRTVARRPLDVVDPRLVHTEADLRDDAARRALDGVDVLWHLGFALWRGIPDAAHINLDGTRNILAARPGRVVFASSAAVYGAWPDNPLPITEDHWPRPNHACPYASQKLRAERICAETAPTVSLRIGAVLGPGMDADVRKATLGYRQAVPAIRGVREALQFLHEDDAASALLAAGMHSVVGVFNVAPADWLSAEDVARVAGSRVVRLPYRVVVKGSGLAFRLRLLPFGADRSVLINGPLALDPGLASDEFGWSPSRGSAAVLAGVLDTA